MLYRVTTLVQIAGVLVLAAGVRHAFEEEYYLVVWVGYVIMRVALASGAGIEIAVQDVVDQAPISSLGVAAATTVPTAVYLVSVWALHVRRYQADPRRWRQSVLPVAAGVVLVCTLLTEWAVPAAGVVCAGAVVVGVVAEGNRGAGRAGGG